MSAGSSGGNKPFVAETDTVARQKPSTADVICPPESGGVAIRSLPQEPNFNIAA